MTARLIVDVALLRTNPHFRRILLARTISLMGLGMLAISVPVQVYALTGSSVQIGVAAALDGAGMLAGLLLGGVLADLHDRRRLILAARSICGLGFVALAINSVLAAPSVAAIYVLAFWDGFFGALGVAALMAAMPQIVGRTNLMQAGALGMLAVRFATVVSPLLGGMVIAGIGVGWNYALAAAATLLTVVTLLGLPPLLPGRVEHAHPLRMLAEAFGFLFRHRLLLGIFALGSLVTLTASVRILFPALAMDHYGGGALATGFLYAAVPAGAALGAALSGWARALRRPGLCMAGCCMLAFACIALLGMTDRIAVGIGVLAVYGYATSIALLLQATMVQGHTPDSYLGRVNSLWAAQQILGETAGAAGIGMLAAFLPPAVAILLLGTAASLLGGLATGACRTIRRAGLGDGERRP